MLGSLDVSWRILKRTQADSIAMDPSATKEARREALMRARQHNLDVASIAKETVRMVLEQAFLVSRPLLSCQ
jgi:nuclear pore complex protein Nup107